MTSVAGLMGPPGASAYSTSKFALEAFADCLRREMGPLTAWAMPVSIVKPSFTNTPMPARAMSEDGLNARRAAVDAATHARWGRPFFDTRFRLFQQRVQASLGTPSMWRPPTYTR